MFETNMAANMQQMSDLKAIQGEGLQSNPWRKLVTSEFRQYLDSISTVKTIEDDAE